MQFRSMKDQVYDYISGEISSGRLASDTEINEGALCTALNISRTPVREALMQLANNGYIEHIPRRGFFTRSLSSQKASNLLQIIGILESAAAAMAMKNGQIDFTTLRKLITKMNQSIQKKDMPAFIDQQTVFHEIINKASGNEDLVRLIENNKKFFLHDKYLSTEATEESLRIATEMNHGHSKIVDLLEAKDRDGLVSYLVEVHWNPRNEKFHAYN